MACTQIFWNLIPLYCVTGGGQGPPDGMKPQSRIHRATDGLVFEGLATYCLEEKKEKKQEKRRERKWDSTGNRARGLTNREARHQKSGLDDVGALNQGFGDQELLNRNRQGIRHVLGRNPFLWPRRPRQDHLAIQHGYGAQLFQFGLHPGPGFADKKTKGSDSKLGPGKTTRLYLPSSSYSFR